MLQSRRLPYVINAFCDPATTLVYTPHVDGTKRYYSLFESYKSFVLKCVDHELLRPLCRCVENDLRIHVHSLELEHMETPSPKAPASAEARRLVHLLNIPPFPVLGVRAPSLLVCLLHCRFC